MTKKLTALVTAGPTREKIDPVRFISNFSSGKQGYAIAKAMRDAGFEVILISGPVNLSAPQGIKTIYIESAEEMLAACENSLPVDVAVCVAAVSDFRPTEFSSHKLKKEASVFETTIKLTQNPDILKTISHHKLRPKIVVGFAAETENLIANATGKLNTKGCDVIVANNVEGGDIFGQDKTSVSILTHRGVERHDNSTKELVANKLTILISNMLENKNI